MHASIKAMDAKLRLFQCLHTNVCRGARNCTYDSKIRKRFKRHGTSGTKAFNRDHQDSEDNHGLSARDVPTGKLTCRLAPRAFCWAPISYPAAGLPTRSAQALRLAPTSGRAHNDTTSKDKTTDAFIGTVTKMTHQVPRIVQ